MNPRNVWPTVTTALGGMALVGLMAIFKVDKDVIVLIAGLTIVPVLAALVAGQGATTAANVQAVQQQTNGNTTKLMEMVEAQGKMLAQMHPPAAGLSTVDTAPLAPELPEVPPQ